MRSLLAACLLTLLTASAVLCGRIDDRLNAALQQKGADDLVKVWIKIEDNHDAVRFRQTIAAQSDSRAERHRSALNSLKSRTSTQDGLKDKLGQLQQIGRADHIKGHWIINLVEAEVAASEIPQIAARSDVELVLEVPEISLIGPIDGPPAHPADVSAAGSNITFVNAPAAWAAGYDGTGRVVCNFDTGVKGDHRALKDSWLGKDGDSAACWFDPAWGKPSPDTVGVNPGGTVGHGTHTMGTMVGLDPVTHDTVGVAWGAKWIAAACVDIAGSSILDAWEWAADPDRNPNTVSDVPDVINHSWGYRFISCTNVYYDAIEHSEALGTVNIFSAGNEGVFGASTIRNPADRANDSLDCFAVGNLEYLLDPPVINSGSGGSSLGPSCDGGIKPNVCAPGTSIRSTWVWGDTAYQSLSGTSMAAPHVSGLVALLRQKNPDATVDQIKTAILASGQTPIGETLPNNTYGWGYIDCMAALAALPAASAQPHVRVFDFTHDVITPGDTVLGTVVLQNLGAAATSVTASITGTNDALTVLDSSVTFGSIGTNGVVSSVDQLEVIVADTVTVGSILAIDFEIVGSGFTTPGRLHFLVEPLQERSIVTHDLGRMQFSLSNFGVYGLGPDLNTSTFPMGGIGFTWDGSGNQVWEAGLIVSTFATHVSSGVHRYQFAPDLDFQVAPGGNILMEEPGPIADQQTFAAFDDSRADRPLGLLIKQESFAYSPPNDDFIILRFIMENLSDSTLSGLYFGLLMDWDAGGSIANAGGYEEIDDILWQAATDGDTLNPVLSEFRGLTLVEGSTQTAGSIPAAQFYPAVSSSPGPGFVPSEKYRIVSSGTMYANSSKTANEDLFSVMAAGPLTLIPGAQDTVSFALVAGSVYGEAADAALRAKAILTDVEDPEPGSNLPDHFVLYQNYPNPFNPTTVIAFDLPRKEEYRLTILNTLGQTVYEETGGGLPGRVEIEWDSEGFASGAYFYKVTAGEVSIARKMLLLK